MTATTDHDRRGEPGRTFVLVHGGGHGGWCFQRVAAALRERGHEVWTPTLTGFGERSHLYSPDRADVPFEVAVTDVVNVLRYEGLDDVVLVGHSLGGVVVPRVAEAAPERIAAVVWLTGPVLNDGETLLEAVPQTPAIAAAVTVLPDGTLETDRDVLLDAILSDGTDDDRRWVAERHVDDYPRAGLTEPGRLSAFLELGIPTAYVAASQDQTIPIELARSFAARLPGSRWVEVDSSHDCMIARPAETAEALIRAAEAR